MNPPRAGSWTAGIRTPGRNCGAGTPFRRPANLVPRHGLEQRRLEAWAAGRRGAPVPTIRNSTWSIGASATRSPTTPGRAKAWTVCTRRACSRSGRRRVRSPAHFQYTPNDVYDVDGTDEQVLADIQVGGQTAQGDDPGEQERLPVRARPHQLQADCGQRLRQSQLGDRVSTSPPVGRC